MSDYLFYLTWLSGWRNGCQWTLSDISFLNYICWYIENVFYICWYIQSINNICWYIENMIYLCWYIENVNDICWYIENVKQICWFMEVLSERCWSFEEMATFLLSYLCCCIDCNLFGHCKLLLFSKTFVLELSYWLLSVVTKIWK